MTDGIPWEPGPPILNLPDGYQFSRRDDGKGETNMHTQSSNDRVLSSAEDRLETVRGIAAERGVSFNVALEIVKRERPALYAEIASGYEAPPERRQDVEQGPAITSAGQPLADEYQAEVSRLMQLERLDYGSACERVKQTKPRLYAQIAAAYGGGASVPKYADVPEVSISNPGLPVVVGNGPGVVRFPNSREIAFRTSVGADYFRAVIAYGKQNCLDFAPAFVAYGAKNPEVFRSMANAEATAAVSQF